MIKKRIIADYFTRSRGNEYKDIIQMAIDHDYKIMSLLDFYLLSKNKNYKKDQRILCLRHDVDIINPNATKTFFEIERELGVKATYYFRYYTINQNLELLKDLKKYNFEVGYHFEEIADFAKKYAINSKNGLIDKIDEIRKNFVRNFNYFKNHYAHNVKSICSHGDWLNVRLNFPNSELVTEDLLDELNLEFEAYQPKLLSLFDVYASDVANFPQIWANGVSAQSVIQKNIPWICMLTHERFWFTNPICNTRVNLKSIFEQLLYKIKTY